jgi:hypothetical protein
VSIIPHPMYTLFRRWRPRKSASKKVILHFGRIGIRAGLRYWLRHLFPTDALPGWKLIIAGSSPLNSPAADEDQRYPDPESIRCR